MDRISRKQAESVCRFLTVLVALEMIGIEEFMAVAVGLEDYVDEGTWDQEGMLQRFSDLCRVLAGV